MKSALARNQTEQKGWVCAEGTVVFNGVVQRGRIEKADISVKP